MGIYEELGVRRVVNAAGTYTAVGASRMRRETLEAMAEASESYVEIPQLLRAVEDRIAEMTRNEAAFVCNSCSTALYLTAAALAEEKTGRPFRSLAPEEIGRCEILCFWNQHIPYDYAMAQTGVRLRFLGDTTAMGGVSRELLRQEIGPGTAGIYFAARTPRGFYAPDRLNLEDVIAVAGEAGVPVIVDAAAQLPPRENLWLFTEMGADLVLFSGGKDLAGPQASGLVLGRKRLIARLRTLGFPNYGIGRIMKIGREEIVGLYAAVRAYLRDDEAARLRRCEEQVAYLTARLDRNGAFQGVRCWPNQAGQPLPRAFVSPREGISLTGAELRMRLAGCNPGIYCLTEGKNGVFINPMCLEDGEMEYIADRICEIGEELCHG